MGLVSFTISAHRNTPPTAYRAYFPNEPTTTAGLGLEHKLVKCVSARRAMRACVRAHSLFQPTTKKKKKKVRMRTRARKSSSVYAVCVCTRWIIYVG